MTAWTFALAVAIGLAATPGDLQVSNAPAGSVRPATARPASIMGAAWNADSSGIPGARLRLRNVATGKIEGATTADEAGQFRFDTVAGGTYVIELVDESGKILALGHVFSIAPAETVATFVRLGTRVPWFTGFFSNAAASAISSAASQGITALAPVARPVSRKQ